MIPASGLIGVELAVGIETGGSMCLLKHGRVGIYFGMKAMMQTADGQNERVLFHFRRARFPVRWACMRCWHRTRGLCLHYR